MSDDKIKSIGKKICLKAGCKKPVRCKGLCKNHYSQFIYHNYPKVKESIRKRLKNNSKLIKSKRSIYYKKKKSEDSDFGRASKDKEKKKLRNEIFLEYSKNLGICDCCKKNCSNHWDLDHLDGSGKDVRGKNPQSDQYYRKLRKNGFPNKDKLVIKCCNCNQSRERHNHIPEDHNQKSYIKKFSGKPMWLKHKKIEHRNKLECITSYCKNTKNEFRKIFSPKRSNYEQWLKTNSGKFVIEKLEAKKICCDICGEWWFDFLTINHIKGGGEKERKSNKIPKGKTLYSYLRRRKFPNDTKYNILCYNCQRDDKKKRENSLE